MRILHSTEDGKKRVGDHFNVLGGGTPTTTNPQFWAGTIPWATSADLEDDFRINIRKKISRKAIDASATNLVPSGSVVVATRVGLGKVGIAETDLCFSQDCQGLIVDKAVCDSKFVAHQLKLRVQIFKHISRGTTIAGVTKKQLLDVPFDLPPLPEQKRIVAEIEKQFTRLEAGIGALKRVQANLKRYRATVLKAACEGRLVPTEAAIAKGRAGSPSRPPKYETGEELLNRILAERREKWQGRGKYKEPAAPDTTNLSKLAEGWVWASLGQIFNLQAGKFISAKEIYAEDTKEMFPCFGGNGIRGYVKRYNQEGLFPLIGRQGALCGNINIASGRFYATEHAIVVRGYADILPEWVFYFLTALNLNQYSTATAQPGLSVATLNKVAIPLPPRAEQKRIVEEVERRLSVVEELETLVSANLQRATRLRQSILQKAFEGRLIKGG